MRVSTITRDENGQRDYSALVDRIDTRTISRTRRGMRDAMRRQNGA